MTAFIGLGSNVGDRLEHLRAAVKAFDRHGIRLLKSSSIYETEPIGPPQPMFLNAAVQVDFEGEPLALLDAVKQIEAEVGRSRGVRWGPREIDLDLLLIGDLEFEHERLRIPHALLSSRSFALIPVIEIDPGARLPSGRALKEFLPEPVVGVRVWMGPEALG